MTLYRVSIVVPHGSLLLSMLSFLLFSLFPLSVMVTWHWMDEKGMADVLYARWLQDRLYSRERCALYSLWRVE